MVVRTGWIALLLASALGLGLGPSAIAADDEWAEIAQPDAQPDAEQPWVETDPSAPPMELILPLHRRLPHFTLNHSLFYSPGSVLLRSRSDHNCGQRLPDLFGSSIDFDFRFWYLFVGAHLAFAGDGDDQWSLGEYAVRGGALIPFGEHFAIVHAVWVGLVDFEPMGVDLQSPFEELSYGQQTGLQLGTSLGVRIMLSSWFGLTADVAVSTTLLALETDRALAPPSGDSFHDSGSLSLNRWQAMTGLVFAW